MDAGRHLRFDPTGNGAVRSAALLWCALLVLCGIAICDRLAYRPISKVPNHVRHSAHTGHYAVSLFDISPSAFRHASVRDHSN